jgi:hypothetical protein
VEGEGATWILLGLSTVSYTGVGTKTELDISLILLIHCSLCWRGKKWSDLGLSQLDSILLGRESW